MEKILVRFKTNWADEMDIDQFFITTKDTWKKYLDIMYTLDKDSTFEIYFGTNEYNEYTLEEYLSEINIYNITPEEEVVINKFFTPTFIPDFTCFLEDTLDEVIDRYINWENCVEKLHEYLFNGHT